MLFGGTPFILDAGAGVSDEVEGCKVAGCGAAPPVEGGTTMAATGPDI